MNTKSTFNLSPIPLFFEPITRFKRVIRPQPVWLEIEDTPEIIADREVRKQKLTIWSYKINWITIAVTLLVILFTALSITDALHWYVPISLATWLNPFTIITMIIYILAVLYWLAIIWCFCTGSNVLKYKLNKWFHLSNFLFFLVIITCSILMIVYSVSSGYNSDTLLDIGFIKRDYHYILQNPELKFVDEYLNPIFKGPIDIQHYINLYTSGYRGLVVKDPNIIARIDNFIDANIDNNDMLGTIRTLSTIERLSIEISSEDFVNLVATGGTTIICTTVFGFYAVIVYLVKK